MKYYSARRRIEQSRNELWRSHCVLFLGKTLDPVPLFINVPVVRKVDNAIHWMNHYQVDSVACFVITYPLDNDLFSE